MMPQLGNETSKKHLKRKAESIKEGFGYLMDNEGDEEQVDAIQSLMLDVEELLKDCLQY